VENSFGKNCLFFSKAVIFNSYSGERIFRQKGFSKTIVIPNCFNDISPTFQRAPKEKIKIITVGRFVEDKDYSTSLCAVNELLKISDNFLFQIVGYGPLENALRKKVRELGLDKHVEIIIKPDNIPELLIEADIYLSTSLFEGTSNAIMEAMNACLPIVATNVGDNSRLVFEGKNGCLHNVGDFKAIAKSLKILTNDYNKRIEFGLESNRMLRENYSHQNLKMNI